MVQISGQPSARFDTRGAPTMNLFDSLVDAYVWVQLSFFESVVQPLAFAWGAGNLLDKAYDGTGWLLVGLLQVLVLVLVIANMRYVSVAMMKASKALKFRL